MFLLFLLTSIWTIFVKKREVAIAILFQFRREKFGEAELKLTIGPACKLVFHRLSGSG